MPPLAARACAGCERARDSWRQAGSSPDGPDSPAWLRTRVHGPRTGSSVLPRRQDWGGTGVIMLSQIELAHDHDRARSERACAALRPALVTAGGRRCCCCCSRMLGVVMALGGSASAADVWGALRPRRGTERCWRISSPRCPLIRFTLRAGGKIRRFSSPPPSPPLQICASRAGWAALVAGCAVLLCVRVAGVRSGGCEQWSGRFGKRTGDGESPPPAADRCRAVHCIRSKSIGACTGGLSSGVTLRLRPAAHLHCAARTHCVRVRECTQGC